MSLADQSIDILLSEPCFSYHKLLETAQSLARSGQPESRSKAIELLEKLRTRYPHVLAIGQELLLALMEDKKYERAEAVLLELEHAFPNLDEETLCRWGRLLKDRGDVYVRLPWSDPDGLPPDREMAEVFYRKALEKYELAYQIRSGHYPGINAATLLHILGSLRPQTDDSSTPEEFSRASARAEELLAKRADWPRNQPDDETLWHPATAGEAHLLRREWDRAAQQYGDALKSPKLTAHARESMRRQVIRIVNGFHEHGISVPSPFDDPDVFFAPAPSATAAPKDQPAAIAQPPSDKTPHP